MPPNSPRPSYAGQSPPLPIEMLTEIIEKLPVRSLLRFKSVCKLWQNIIESPEFVRQQLDYSHRRSKTSSNAGEKIFLQLRLLADPMNLRSRHHYYSAETGPYDSSSTRYLHQPLKRLVQCSFVCSGDGLILLHRVECQSMFLWNPSTNKIREIPGPPQSSKGYIIASGFGYDSSIQDYKIVRIDVRYCSQPRVKALVLALKTASWRTIQGFPDSYQIEHRQNTVFTHGAVHFLARPIGPEPESKYAILRVNLAEERFMEEILSAPTSKLTIIDCCAFKLLEGSLCLQLKISLIDRPDLLNCTFEVWSMMEYGNSDSWTRILSVPYWSFPPLHIPIAVLQNGDLLIRKNSGLFLGDERNARKLLTPEIANSTSAYFIAIHTYSESLVAP